MVDEILNDDRLGIGDGNDHGILGFRAARGDNSRSSEVSGGWHHALTRPRLEIPGEPLVVVLGTLQA